MPCSYYKVRLGAHSHSESTNDARTHDIQRCDDTGSEIKKTHHNLRFGSEVTHVLFLSL